MTIIQHISEYIYDKSKKIGSHIPCGIYFHVKPITIDMVSGRHVELKKWRHWKSLNCHNSKYIDEERTQIGTNKLYDM